MEEGSAQKLFFRNKRVCGIFIKSKKKRFGKNQKFEIWALLVTFWPSFLTLDTVDVWIRHNRWNRGILSHLPLWFLKLNWELRWATHVKEGFPRNPTMGADLHWDENWGSYAGLKLGENFDFFSKNRKTCRIQRVNHLELKNFIFQKCV